MKKRIALLFLICLLAACNSESSSSNTEPTNSKDETPPSAKEVLEKVEENQKDMESVKVEFKEMYADSKDTGVEKYDYKNKIGYFEYDDSGLVMYKDNDGFILSIDGIPASPKANDLEVYELKFDDQMSQHKNQIYYLKEFDSDIYKKFDLEDKEESYKLTYNGNEQDQLQVMQGIADEYNESLSEVLGRDVNADDLTVDKLHMVVEIGKGTNQIERFEQEMKYSQFVDGKNRSYDQKVIYDYSDYNELDTISKPKLENEGNTEGTSHSLSKEEKKRYEEEAAAYVDALIQATIFQNVDKYIERAPGSLSEEEKKSEGDMQKDSFKDIYIQNTKQNMQGSNVTGAQINDLAEAFLKALSTTEYEVEEATAQSERELTVELTVQGINDNAIYNEAGQELKELYENGKVAEEGLDTKNIEILIEKYNDVDDLHKPVTVEVDVIRTADSYEVLMQDQYLKGFVQ